MVMLKTSKTEPSSTTANMKSKMMNVFHVFLAWNPFWIETSTTNIINHTITTNNNNNNNNNNSFIILSLREKTHNPLHPHLIHPLQTAMQSTLTTWLLRPHPIFSTLPLLRRHHPPPPHPLKVHGAAAAAAAAITAVQNRTGLSMLREIQNLLLHG
jgi:hypothetical protein